MLERVIGLKAARPGIALTLEWSATHDAGKYRCQTFDAREATRSVSLSRYILQTNGEKVTPRSPFFNGFDRLRGPHTRSGNVLLKHSHQ